LSSLPSELYGLNLESLNLADNQLVVLDERLTKLKNLKQLNLANNQLESLPECVLALPLIQLVIDKNPLRAPFDALLDKGNQVQPKLAQVLAACFGKKADAGEVRGEDLVSKLLVA
jgi:Leucine-rich repeat (LRR) protein